MKTALIVGGGVVLVGGFAFLMYRKTHAAVVASAAPPGAPAAAPAARASSSLTSRLNGAAGVAGGLVGRAASIYEGVPFLGGAASGAGSVLGSQGAVGLGQSFSGTKEVLTGHPVQGVKDLAHAGVTASLAPVKALGGALKHLF